MGPSGLYKTGSSEDKNIAGNYRRALISRGGTEDGGQDELAFGGEHDHSHDCGKIVC